MTRTIGVLLTTVWVTVQGTASAKEAAEARGGVSAETASAKGNADTSAETGAEASAENAKETEARIQFEQGREFYNQGAYEKAAIALRRAFELRPSYRILYYLGWAESETGNYNRALTAFETYLKEAEGEEPLERIDEVAEEVTKLKARVGHLTVSCAIEGATVKVDNETRGTTPLAGPIPVNIGRHEVTVMDGATSVFTEVIRIAGGQEITLTVPERQAAAPTELSSKDAAAPVENGPKPASKSKRIWTFVAYGIAAAVGVGAGVTGALALNQQNDIWDQCDSDGNCYSEDYDGDFHADSDRVRTLALTTDILIGTAALFAIAGTVLVFIEPSLHEKSSAAAAVPRVLLGPGGVSVTGRF